MTQRKRTIILVLLILVVILSIIWIISAANTYTYSAEEVQEICQSRFLRTHLDGQALRTSIHSREFYKFTVDKTTQQQVLNAVGDPHATTGSGFLYYVYFTSDKYLAHVTYNTFEPTVSYIFLYNIQDGTIIPIAT